MDPDRRGVICAVGRRRVVLGLCFSLVVAVAACAAPRDDLAPSGGAATGAGEEEIRAASTATFEGKLSASTEAVTGFAIEERRGPEDREIVAVDFSGLRLPGQLLAGKTLRIKGRLEKRQTGTLPNGTAILRDVLVAREIIEPTEEDHSIEGVLERRSGAYYVVERIPKNAPPNDQDTVETRLELGTVVNGRSLLGSEVVASGRLARKVTGALRDRFLISSDVLVVATLNAASGP